MDNPRPPPDLEFRCPASNSGAAEPRPRSASVHSAREAPAHPVTSAAPASGWMHAARCCSVGALSLLERRPLPAVDRSAKPNTVLRGHHVQLPSDSSNLTLLARRVEQVIDFATRLGTPAGKQ